MSSTAPATQINVVVAAVRDALGTNVRAMYLHGSAVAGGLKPASDLDLFVVTQRPTTADEKLQLINALRPISSRAMRPAGWRPVELTIVVESDIRPWRYPPRMDFQYGEWLREQFDAGIVPDAGAKPDLAVLLTIVSDDSRTLVGSPPRELLDPVPPADLERAMLDSVPDLLTDLDTDTTNVILTLARIWMTLATGRIGAKDEAADWALDHLPAQHGAVIVRARSIYLGDEPDEWRDLSRQVEAIADFAVADIQQVARAKRTLGRD